MLNSIEKILDSGLGKHIIRDTDLLNLFDGTPASRYGLINKGLKKGELIRLRRGLYTLAPKYLEHSHSQYYLSNHILSHSFVTAESALNFHGWIPEQVLMVTSIVAFGRNRQFNTEYGTFIYRVIPIDAYQFLKGVQCFRIAKQWVWIATPLRALMDYVYWHKIDNANMDFLIQSLRIEPECLSRIKKKDIITLQAIYRSKRVIQFLQNLLSELNHG